MPEDTTLQHIPQPSEAAKLPQLPPLSIDTMTQVNTTYPPAIGGRQTTAVTSPIYRHHDTGILQHIPQPSEAAKLLQLPPLSIDTMTQVYTTYPPAGRQTTAVTSPIYRHHDTGILQHIPQPSEAAKLLQLPPLSIDTMTQVYTTYPPAGRQTTAVTSPIYRHHDTGILQHIPQPSEAAKLPQLPPLSIDTMTQVNYNISPSHQRPPNYRSYLPCL
jgi:hypothetical protein